MRRKASKEKDYGGAAKRYLEEKYIMDQRPQLDASAADYHSRYEQYRKTQAHIIKYSAPDTE